MARYAVVANGAVTNIVLWDGLSKWTPASGIAVLIPPNQAVAIGWLYVKGAFVAPLRSPLDINPGTLPAAPAAIA